MMTNAERKFLLGGGLLLVAAALFLTGSNLWEADQAAQASEQVLRQLERVELPVAEVQQTEENSDSLARVLDQEVEMPEREVDGNLYIGVLEIPTLELELPVMSRWSESSLEISPCRYQGSAYKGDLILAAHNYPRHFGGLGSLTRGDAVFLTDMKGNRFFYTVSRIERLDGTAIQEMEQGSWDLTLFTCTLDGTGRITVRCNWAGEE